MGTIFWYTVSDGLAGLQVEDVYQDRRGLLWIATADGGISRFDGECFDTFGLGEGLPHRTVIEKYCQFPKLMQYTLALK